MILVRRRSSKKLRSMRFVVRTCLRWAAGRRRWARLASRSSRSENGESAGMETSGHGDTSGRITRIGNSRADACETPDGLCTSMYLFKLS